MLQADPNKVSSRAKKRGLPQLGTLGAGNHYAEIQVVEEIFDRHAATKMGIDQLNQVVLMIHCGSRGMGHQVATDALVAMERAMKRDKIEVNDRQLACAHVDSPEGQDYLKAMAAAANYAWVNRSSMTFLARQAFAKIFNSTPDDLDMHIIYDVSHNIAKVEEHWVDGKIKTLLVHRKGSTRAFPPHHPLIPVDYQVSKDFNEISCLRFLFTEMYIAKQSPSRCYLTIYSLLSSEIEIQLKSTGCKSIAPDAVDLSYEDLDNLKALPRES
ncbi:unnamed protein product [Echinostoma caproni]|uniref:3'-phosphate/5'-hydroxy nucleic acid ligase n=1 Tax=Echinostoma caproni TaxID=27848 RepID=A0A183B5Q5_9TREM|nr:unnamed protein product [Echinostoma caproni]